MLESEAGGLGRHTDASNQQDPERQMAPDMQQAIPQRIAGHVPHRFVNGRHGFAGQPQRIAHGDPDGMVRRREAAVSVFAMAAIARAVILVRRMPLFLRRGSRTAAWLSSLVRMTDEPAAACGGVNHEHEGGQGCQKRTHSGIVVTQGEGVKGAVSQTGEAVRLLV